MTRLENISKSFKSTQRKIEAFLHGEKWKEALVFFFFALLAVGFWFLQSLQQEYEIEIEIPVKYKNVPPDIAFSSTVPEVITAKVKDKGSVLLNYTIGRSFLPIEVSMKKSPEKNGILQISKKQIETDIQKQLISTTSLLGFEPQLVSIPFNQRVKKEIPVSFDGDIHNEPGFLLAGDIQITPSSVTAYATKAILDSLVSIKTTFVQIDNGNKTLTKTVQLQQVDGVNFDPDVVTITIPIEEFTEKTLDIPVSCSSVPPHYTVRVFPATVKVICSVPLSRFKELSEKMFEIVIPFGNMEQNVSGAIPIMLTKKPDWVHNTTLMPDKVEFILEYTATND